MKSHDLYLTVTKRISLRGQCVRRQVGALVVNEGRILGVGWNGFPPGQPTCLDGACPRSRAFAPVVKAGTGYAETGCVVIHAETRAIVAAGREGCDGATIYVNEEPCVLCNPLVHDVGLARLVWGKPGDFKVVDL